MSNKKGPGGRKGIHFVNARPSSESEKLSLQRLVRAHVGKWISDQTKDRSSPPGPEDLDPERPGDSTSRITIVEEEEGWSPSSSSAKSSRTSPASNSSSSSSSLIPPPTSCEPKPQSTPMVLVSQHDNDYNNYQPTQRDTIQRTSDSRSLSPFVNPAHVGRLGSGLFDPFHTYPSSLPPEAIHLCETYCLTILWPNLTPRSPHESGPTANISWFPLSLHDPTLFTAFLFGSLSHQRVQWINRTIPESAFGRKEQRLLELVEHETLKMVSAGVADPDRAMSDSVLMGVIAMAHNRAEERDFRKHPDPPFTAPLRQLQWLDVYGSQTANLVHVQGLIQMIQMRGGLENIRTPGIASIISFSGIFTASTLLGRPMFPFIPLDESRKGLDLQALLGFNSHAVQHGFGDLIQIGVTPQMAEVFQAMKVYISIVENYLCGNHKAFDVSLLCDQRNLVVYNLLHLAPGSELGTDHNHEIIYELCRLAGLVYGVGVVFPLPAQSNPLARLAGFIKATLRVAHHSAIWAPSRQRIILLWVLTLGGIAAENTPDRGWFVNALGQATSQSRIFSWFDLRNLLGQMLWYDRACDIPGRNLWREVESFGRTRI